MKKILEKTETYVERFKAADGTIFRSEKECVDYENSALVILSSRLKRLSKNNSFQCSICPGYGEEQLIEVYDCPTEQDLQFLLQYLVLKTNNPGFPKYADKLTAGHEIIVFWTYDEDDCWVIGDGTFDSYIKTIKEGYKSILN